MGKQSQKAHRRQEHGKKEPTVACDKNDSASMEDVAGVEGNVAAAQIQKQMKKENKKADRGQQHGKKESTVAPDKHDCASMENVAGVEEDVAVASCRLVAVEEEVAAAQIQTQMKKENKKADRGQQYGKKEPTVAFYKTILCRWRM